MLIIFFIDLVKFKIIFTLSRPRIRFFLGLMMRMEAEFRLLPGDICPVCLADKPWLKVLLTVLL